MKKTFVVQEHHASHLHYDLRLEKEGVLKSWAVPRGIPLKPGIKRLAVETKDHPIEYAEFEGEIPKGEYGAGTVKIWDKGEYEEKTWQEDKIVLLANGKKMHGLYTLIRLKGQGKNWILFKSFTQR